MKSSIEQEKIFFNYFLSKGQYLKKVNDGFFSNSDINYIIKLAKEFFLKFNEIPSKNQIKAIIVNNDKDLSEDIIDSLFDINLDTYDPDWLHRTAEAWIKWKHFNKQFVRTVEFIKTKEVNPDNVEDVVQSAINMISTDGFLHFDKDIGLDFFDPESHVQRLDKKIRSGWNFINNISGGGYDPKTLIVYAGQQGIGKSIWLCNDAANFISMGSNVAFISAEMSAKKVLKRIGSNLLDISMAEYDKISINKEVIKRKLSSLRRGVMEPGRLFVKEVPTSQFSVLDIEAYLKELEETKDIKIDVLIVDYINILSNYRNPNSENTYLKVKQISEDLRAIGVKKDLLVISATQINRKAFNSTHITVESIAESVGLGYTVDVLYAIIQDEIMFSNKQFILSVLKFRDADGLGRKHTFNINYDKMRIIEDLTISI